MAMDPANRRMCPNENCGAAIEKRGGCHKVSYIKCKVNICWKCMKYFTTETETYGHLTTNCPNNPNHMIDD